MSTYFQTLAPLAPELVLVLGAMVLLMLGVFRRETDANAEKIGWLAIVLLLIVVGIPDAEAVDNVAPVRRRVSGRCFRPLHEGVGADRVGGCAAAVVRRHARRKVSASSSIRSWCCSRRPA